MWMELAAADGHRFEAYQAGLGQPRALIVIQEIFGVNEHIREVCERFAAAGYRVLAPALFDRVRPKVELGYDPPSIPEGRRLVESIGGVDPSLADLEACRAYLAGEGLGVAVTGFCWGGFLTWIAACRVEGLVAGVGYYGGRIPQYLDEQPGCPVLLHFAGRDAHVPLTDVDAIRAAHPEVAVQVYPEAEHGFNCDHRGSYHEPSAQLAWGRTLGFLEKAFAERSA